MTVRCCRSPDDIDLFAGGVAERSVDKGVVGPTFACIIADHFRSIKLGDRFWFENEGKQGFTPGMFGLFIYIWGGSVVCVYILVCRENKIKDSTQVLKYNFDIDVLNKFIVHWCVNCGLMIY